MWYVVQTITGKEKELVAVLDRVLKKECYERCFVIQRECVWRIQGHYRLHIELMFPSYIFVETDMPEKFYFALKQIPKSTKLLGGGEAFLPIQAEEENLLKKMIAEDPDNIVRRTLVTVNSKGELCLVEGMLKGFSERIVKKRLRKRYVIIEIPFLGRTKRVRVGIQLEGDKEICE